MVWAGMGGGLYLSLIIYQNIPIIMKTIPKDTHFHMNMHRSQYQQGKFMFDISANNIKCFIQPSSFPYDYGDQHIGEMNTLHADLKACNKVEFNEKEFFCGIMGQLFPDEQPASIRKTVLTINYSPGSTSCSKKEADSFSLLQSWRAIFNSTNEAALQGKPWPIYALAEESRQNWTQLSPEKEDRSTFLSSQSSRESLPDYSLCLMQKTALYMPLETKRRSCPAASCFAIDSSAIQRDGRTTLMIRHIPNKYTEQMLFRQFPRKFRDAINFLYLPLDAYNECNMGYAFINFVHTRHIRPFLQEFSGRKWSRFNSGKICQLAYARIQGTNSLNSHFPEGGRRRGKTEDRFLGQHNNTIA